MDRSYTEKHAGGLLYSVNREHMKIGEGFPVFVYCEFWPLFIYLRKQASNTIFVYNKKTKSTNTTLHQH